MSSPNNLSVIGHLEELRARLIRTGIAFLVSFAAAFIYVRDIYAWLVRDMEKQLVVLGPSDVIWVYFTIAGVIALVVTLPVAAYQTWRFVQPAITVKVRRSTVWFIPAVCLLFIAGMSFGYFVLFPMLLNVLHRMAEGSFEMMYTAEKYFTFMVHMTLPFGLLFEMPAAVMFLTKVGILNPAKLAKARKVSYFVLVVVAVMITPPDILSDIIVIVPLFLLYEASVGISKFVFRKQLSESQA